MSEQLLRLNVVDDDPHTVAVYGFNCVIVQYAFRCVQDMEGDQEEGGDSGVGGGVDASWLEADGRIGMVGQAQQREEGVFFHTGSGVRQRRQEGAGLCTPLHSSRVIYLIVFSPRPAVQLGQPEHKRPGVHSSPRTWPPVRRSPTFDKLLHNTWVIQTDSRSFSFAYSGLYSQIAQGTESSAREPSHTRKQLAPRDTPITSDTVAIFLWRHAQMKLPLNTSGFITHKSYYPA